MSKFNRRAFLRLSSASVIGVTLGGISLRSYGAEQVDPEDPTAKALKYVHKSEVEGKNCANCTHLQAGDDPQWKPCALFPGKLVNKDGWCSAWMAKA
ncbi:high-potential iron-sulfur protein [Thalassotalea mangrovi]|uniref:High-potential iron-sulfur protein n=1 Tax=Thalassotalea mangrovi TaxID=2572245 RepID=A0A4U1BB99_9GAMM|nr:high-potential iron-sulfur protein [Thalassotalea mangrovi]TKB47448.1 high-potential iron sulfur protein 2 [Thalassotalea mangrovi]